jgi:hypothetical protein
MQSLVAWLIVNAGLRMSHAGFQNEAKQRATGLQNVFSSQDIAW